MSIALNRTSRLKAIACCTLLLGLFPFSVFAGDLDSANILFSKGNYEEAIPIYSRILNTVIDEDGTIMYRMGVCCLLSGRLSEARKYLDLAKQRNPNVFSGRISRVPSGSMEPTLLLGDYIIVKREFYAFSAIKRNDVVALKIPGIEDKHLYVKRIIGLPGEKLEIRNNVVYIDDKKFDEDRFGALGKSVSQKSVIAKDFGPKTIPEGSYFVLGDNRNTTFDSRHFGFVARQAIAGKVLGVYQSIDSTQDPPIIRQDRTGLVIK